MKHRQVLRDGLITLSLLAASTGISLMVGGWFGTQSGGFQNTQMVYLLAVLLISRFTSGYFWGLLSAIISVPLVNYLFTYPYFVFNLSISGYLLTFVTMLTVSIIVSILTSRLQQQDQLRLEAEKEKLRANLLRAVSHDLRTPLTSIVGTTGAILDGNLPPPKQRELLQDVNTDAQWLLRMMENLLTLTRTSGSAGSLHLETEVVEEVLSTAISKFSKHFSQVEVVLELPEEILLAEMDPVLIEQVVLNLLENAVYHGMHTSRIRITAAHDGQRVSVSVSDNGAGIPRDKLPVLFSGALSCEHSSDTHRHMGIGLSVCTSIIKAHGGRMTAQNNPSGGATFLFTLVEKEYHDGCQDFDCGG